MEIEYDYIYLCDVPVAFFLGLRVERGFLAGEVEGVVLLLPVIGGRDKGALVWCVFDAEKGGGSVEGRGGREESE
jgi:hypothetical protein